MDSIVTTTQNSNLVTTTTEDTNVDINKKQRNFPKLPLDGTINDITTLTATSPLLVIQSPKTPTLSRKLKAVSLDSQNDLIDGVTNDITTITTTTTNDTLLNVRRDVFSMPNTPKRQIRTKTIEQNNGTSGMGTNLKKFGSNNSISGSQTLKTLPEIMTLQDFTLSTTTESGTYRTKTKGLLERRGSNASLTIDLTNATSTNFDKQPLRLNTAKSVSNLNLTTFDTSHIERCACVHTQIRHIERRKSQETCGNCIIYESIPSQRANGCPPTAHRCRCTNVKCRRKSLSNENLYVPPCGFCQTGSGLNRDLCRTVGNSRKAHYPRQSDMELSQLSDEFKLHLENVQYLQTAGNLLNMIDLKCLCDQSRVPKLHQEFWEIPLNLQEKCYVSGSQNLNRYRGVLPNEHSRVYLNQQNYIHANYIKGPDYTETAYIATQGPMAHTCQDFWEMVWMTKCNCIVMLTELVENGRNKCELYFPLGKKSTTNIDNIDLTINTLNKNEHFTYEQITNEQTNDVQIKKYELIYGNYHIKLINDNIINESYTIRYLELTNKLDINEKLLINHLWYKKWQDHKMANPVHVLDMALNVIKMAKKPIIVHCSAGIGRTGCFLAILNGIQQLNTNGNVDVLGIICSLRLNRGGMVQTAEQYEFIHRVLGLYADQLIINLDK